MNDEVITPTFQTNLPGCRFVRCDVCGRGVWVMIDAPKFALWRCGHCNALQPARR